MSKKAGRAMFKAFERSKVFDKYESHCAYCGQRIAFDKFQVDHLKPKMRGGTDDISNLMPACARCNRWKATYSIEEFREEIALQVERLRRRVAGFRLAEDFGLIDTFSVPVKFWFERGLEASK